MAAPATDRSLADKQAQPAVKTQAPWLGQTSTAWRGLSSLRTSWALIAICTGVLALVLILWRTGRLQSIELKLYDQFLRAQSNTSTTESPVVIVGITEDDLLELNSSLLPDDVLSSTLQMLVAGEPATIIVDLYRNLPVPGNDPDGRKHLAEIFTKNPHIIAIQRLGLGNEPAVGPPPFLANSPYQLGYNDFGVLDVKIDDTVRRVALKMEDNKIRYRSDPLMAVFLYLGTHDIPYEEELPDTRLMQLGKSTLRRFETHDGAYVNADARGYQMLLDFRGPAKFPTYSIHEARSGKIPAEEIRGKVVIVGPLAPSLKDFLNTPMGGRFPGLLLHAHIVDQLLRQALHGDAPLRFWSEWQEALWLFLWCAIGTFAGSSVRSPLVFIVVVAGCLGVIAAAFWFSMLADLWLPAAAPAIAFTCTAALSTSHQAYLEKKQRNMLMDLFSQHVSTNVAVDIWNHRDQFMDGHRPRPQVLRSTVIFTDLKGFTGKAEALSPEALIDWLNEYMEVMARLVDQHGGIINKYMGDAIMAVFGAPIPRTTDEEIRRDAGNSVRCALAMGEELNRLNEDWQKRGLPTTTMRVGIASGSVVSGSIGGAGRVEYTVTGDTVVTAKRLESLEKDAAHLEMATSSCRVLMTEETFSKLDPQFKARKVGPMRLDGKNRMVNVYVLIGEEGRHGS